MSYSIVHTDTKAAGEQRGSLEEADNLSHCCYLVHMVWIPTAPVHIDPMYLQLLLQDILSPGLLIKFTNQRL